MSVQPPPSYAPPAYQQGPAPGVRYSGRLGRFIAYLIDGFVISAILFVFYGVGGVLLVMGAGGDGGGILALIGSLIILVGIIAAMVYKPLMWSRSGQTFGYKLMRLRLVRAVDGSPISGGQAVGRLLGYIASAFFYLGFIWIMFDDKRQGWHDKLAATVVIEV